VAEGAAPPVDGRRWGWTALAVVAGLLVVLTAVSSFVALVVVVAHHELGAAASITVRGVTGVVFWTWIRWGALRRTEPPDPDLTPSRTAWTPVVSVLNAVLLLGLGLALAGGLWLAVDGARRDRDADDLREQVELAAKTSDLTRAEVARVQEAHITWTATHRDGDGEPDPYAALLPDVEVSVLDVAVGPDRVAVLLRGLHQGPPCVVLVIDEHDLVRTRTTRACA
jgi:hypothetical protein